MNTEASRLATRTRIARFAMHNGIFVALLVLLTFMLLTKPQFGTAQNLSNILQQNAVIGVLACGMTFAIIIGGFDLSVGSTAALSTVVTATLFASGRAIALPLGIQIHLKTEKGPFLLTEWPFSLLVCSLAARPYWMALQASSETVCDAPGRLHGWPYPGTRLE